MKENRKDSTLEMAVIDPRNIEATDLLGLCMAIVGGTTPSECLERGTLHLALRLGATACACLGLELDSNSRDLLFAADAFGVHPPGSRLLSADLSREVRTVLNRALEWARDPLGADDQDSAIGLEVSQPPPPVRGVLLGRDEERGYPQSGLIVPLVFERQVVGILWIGPSHGGEAYTDWDVAIVQTGAAMLAQSLGRLVKERMLSDETRQREREYQRQLERTERHQKKVSERLHSVEQQLIVYAHDMRAPLGVIAGHVNIMRNMGMNESQRRCLDAMDRQGTRLLSMIGELLATRQQRALVLKLEFCNLDALWPSWVDDWRMLAQRANVSFEAEISPGVATRRIDAGKLLQILTNLVENAIKFSGKGGKVGVTAEAGPDDSLWFHVVDSGPGLSQAALEESFALFYSEGETAGHGIGLAAVKEFVELHGGQVTVRNRDEGGAEFTVVVPAPSEGSDRQIVVKPSERKRILAVDSDSDRLMGVVEALSGRFDVLTARSDREALWILQQEPIDGAVIDLNLPLMTGFATAAALRKDPSRAQLPVLFVADADVGGVALRQRAESRKDVLTRPLVPEELGQRVESIIEESRQRQEVIEASHLDSLTGLLAREPAVVQLERSLDQNRVESHHLSILLIDVDNMGEINRAFGQKAADGLLRELGQTLGRVTRSEEYAARWGEDEFLCILPSTPETAAQIVAERLRVRLARCRMESASATVSVGVATVTEREPAMTAQDLATQAFGALTEAKRQGGNVVVCYRAGRET